MLVNIDFNICVNIFINIGVNIFINIGVIIFINIGAIIIMNIIRILPVQLDNEHRIRSNDIQIELNLKYTSILKRKYSWKLVVIYIYYLYI